MKTTVAIPYHAEEATSRVDAKLLPHAYWAEFIFTDGSGEVDVTVFRDSPEALRKWLIAHRERIDAAIASIPAPAPEHF